MHRSAERPHGRRREHAFGRTADPRDDVEAATAPRGTDAPFDVAVFEKLDGCPCRLSLGDESLVARPLLHGDPHVGRGDPTALRPARSTISAIEAPARTSCTHVTCFSM